MYIIVYRYIATDSLSLVKLIIMIGLFKFLILNIAFHFFPTLKNKCLILICSHREVHFKIYLLTDVNNTAHIVESIISYGFL